MKKQNIVFSLLKTKVVLKNTLPKEFLTFEYEMKQQLIKKGYVVKSITKQEVYLLSAVVGKYNVPIKERIEFQKWLDKKYENKIKN